LRRSRDCHSSSIFTDFPGMTKPCHMDKAVAAG
jgi:hypothetical protein